MIDKILIFLRLFLYLQDVRKTGKNTHAYCRSRHTDGTVREHTSDAGYNWRLHAGAHHRYHRADGVCHSVDDALHVFSAVECRRLGALRILFVCLLPPLMYTFLLELLCDGQTVGEAPDEDTHGMRRRLAAHDGRSVLAMADGDCGYRHGVLRRHPHHRHTEASAPRRLRRRHDGDTHRRQGPSPRQSRRVRLRIARLQARISRHRQSDSAAGRADRVRSKQERQPDIHRQRRVQAGRQGGEGDTRKRQGQSGGVPPHRALRLPALCAAGGVRLQACSLRDVSHMCAIFKKSVSKLRNRQGFRKFARYIY